MQPLLLTEEEALLVQALLYRLRREEEEPINIKMRLLLAKVEAFLSTPPQKREKIFREGQEVCITDNQTGYSSFGLLEYDSDDV